MIYVTCFGRNCASNALTYVTYGIFDDQNDLINIELSYVFDYRPVVLFSWMLVKSGLLYASYLVMRSCYMLYLRLCAINWMLIMLLNALKLAHLTRYLKVNTF